MKKNVVIILVILTLILSLLPLSIALAKTGGNVTLFVKNQTGGNVILTLFDVNGKRMILTYHPGLFNTLILQGNYRYYVSTPCGNQAGIFNLNRNKQLYFSCANGRQILLDIPIAPTVVPTPCPQVNSFHKNNNNNCSPG